MACIDSDGTLTATGRALLQGLADQPLTAEGIAQAMEEPLFKVRGRIREMVQADLIEERDGAYAATEKGLGMI
jgi:predicted transcriptional regulator